MGDRANIVIRETWPEDLSPREAVFLYSHWGGYELPAVLQAALAKRWRWDDPSYLARIIFDVMLSGDHEAETGYGISTRLTDNEHPLLVCRGDRVYLLAESDYTARGFDALDEARSLTFEQYLALEPVSWDALDEALAPEEVA